MKRAGTQDGSARAANRRLAGVLALVAAGFLGFGFGLVPLYNSFCQVTGDIVLHRPKLL
jgi:cytochrome c oxidase assembly protein Cox11